MRGRLRYRHAECNYFAGELLLLLLLLLALKQEGAGARSPSAAAAGEARARESHELGFPRRRPGAADIHPDGELAFRLALVNPP